MLLDDISTLMHTYVTYVTYMTYIYIHNIHDIHGIHDIHIHTYTTYITALIASSDADTKKLQEKLTLSDNENTSLRLQLRSLEITRVASKARK